MPTFLIVGASLAGASAAAALRGGGFDGRLVMVGEEPLPPYERPPLSKEYLRGEQPLEEGFVRPPEWYAEQGIEARFGTRVERVDVAASEVVLAGGERIAYDRVLVATGSRNRRLGVPGADLPGVFDLRTVADCDRIREAASRSSRAVLVGMGFIGAELAASFRQLGLEVVAVEFFGTVLERVLGPQLGRVLEAIHRDHGVGMVFGDAAARFEGDGRFEAVVTRAGRRLEGDLCVVGVGTVPATEVLEGTGVPIDGGIHLDARLRSPVPDLFAAGDVVLHDHPVFGKVRVEHFDNAIKMGEAAARAMLGADEVFDDPHWFWSDQYDVNIQVAGIAASWDRMVVRGSLEARSFAAFLLQDGVLRSTVTVAWPRDARRSLPLIRAQARPDPAALADPEVDLRTLLPKEDG